MRLTAWILHMLAELLRFSAIQSRRGGVVCLYDGLVVRGEDE